MDRFEDLRTFVTLVQEGGFAAAAERLGIVKSAVSRRIRDIEERLDARLLQRTSRQFSLTEAGRVYHGKAIAILEAVASLDEAVRTEASGLVGSVRVAMPITFAANCFSSIALGFGKSNPDVTLEIISTDDELDLIREGYDLALVISPLQDSALMTRRLFEVRYSMCASPSYLAAHGRPVNPADLSGHVAIGTAGEKGDVAWELRDGVRVKMRCALRSTSSEFARDAAKGGAGIAFLPTFAIADAVVDGTLEIVLPAYAREPLALYVLFPASRHVPARVRALIDYMTRLFDGPPVWDQRIAAIRHFQPD